MRTQSKPGFLSLLLLGFLLLCLTVQTTARVLETRTDAQPAASGSQSGTDDADRNIVARRLVLSEKVSSIKLREPGEYPPDHGVERRSARAETAGIAREGHTPGHVSEDHPSGHGSRLRVRA